MPKQMSAPPCHAGRELAVLTSAAVILFRQVSGCPACEALFESPAGVLGDHSQAELDGDCQRCGEGGLVPCVVTLS